MDGLASELLARAGFVKEYTLRGIWHRLPFDMGVEWENEHASLAAEMLRAARYPVRLDAALSPASVPSADGVDVPPSVAAAAQTLKARAAGGTDLQQPHESGRALAALAQGEDSLLRPAADVLLAVATAVSSLPARLTTATPGVWPSSAVSYGSWKPRSTASPFACAPHPTSPRPQAVRSRPPSRSRRSCRASSTGSATPEYASTRPISLYRQHLVNRDEAGDRRRSDSGWHGATPPRPYTDAPLPGRPRAAGSRRVRPGLDTAPGRRAVRRRGPRHRRRLDRHRDQPAPRPP